MAADRVVVVGGSAGGIPALTALLGALPTDLPAAVVVVLHRSTRSSGTTLASILQRASRLPVSEVIDELKLEHGRVYLAPADLHTVVVDGVVRAITGPRENYHRPSIDILFRSAARAWRKSVVGIVLSGTREDGASGMAEVRRTGGLGVVQDPKEAQFPSLPRVVIERAGADHVATVAAIAELVSDWAGTSPAGQPHPETHPLRDPFEHAPGTEIPPDIPGAAPPAPALFSCPECGGAMFPVAEEGEFRCYIGHSATEESLLHHKEEERERALWSGVRALEETAALSRRLAARMHRTGAFAARDRFAARAERAQRDALQLRQIAGGQLHGSGGPDPEELEIDDIEEEAS